MRPIQTPSRPTTHRVDPHEHFDGVTGPGGDFGAGHAGVEPPGDPGVARVVGRFMSGEASWSGVSAAARTFCQTCRQVEGWMGLPVSDRNSPPSGAVPYVAMWVRRSSTSWGGMGTLRTGLRACGLRGGSAFGAAFEAAVLVDLAVVGVGPACGGAGVGEGQVAPHPCSGRWQLALVRAATSEGASGRRTCSRRTPGSGGLAVCRWCRRL